MAKVSFFDKRLLKHFQQITSAIFALLAGVLIFVDIPKDSRIIYGISITVFLLIIYFTLWIKSNRLQDITLSIEGSSVNIKTGDIFNQQGLKAIAFNEYFDTIVDDKIISKRSLNGLFIQNYLSIPLQSFDDFISHYPFDKEDISEAGVNRTAGKSTRYKLGTICLFSDYILTAFSKFDSTNRAYLTMPEYLEFLINFWDSVNKVYAQKSVSTTIFGSGITRIKGHRNITDEDLLKIMLWTFRISEMRFKHPAKLTIVIHKDKINQINLLDIQSAKNGI